MVEYTATTSDTSNKVTATPTDNKAEVLILLGDTEIQNGGDATWAEGENTLTITVSEFGAETVYTVVVTAE